MLRFAKVVTVSEITSFETGGETPREVVRRPVTAASDWGVGHCVDLSVSRLRAVNVCMHACLLSILDIFGLTIIRLNSVACRDDVSSEYVYVRFGTSNSFIVFFCSRCISVQGHIRYISVSVHISAYSFDIQVCRRRYETRLSSKPKLH